MAADERIVYGAACSWWDSISEVERLPSGLPCCPHCRGVLFQAPTEAQWWEAIDAHVQAGHPDYRVMLEWSRGQCYPTYSALSEAWAAWNDLPDEVPSM
jgi:hypothetical protein